MRAARLAALALLSGALACGGGGVVPRVDLAERLAVERDLADLRQTWEGSGWEGVLGMAPALDAHIQRFPSDPSTRTVRAMRALVALEQSDLPRARQLADELLLLPDEGSTRDAASVVSGSLEARAGRPQKALEQLSALYNRIIDAPTRAFLNRELARAAIGARRFDDAARYLSALVRQSGGPLRPFAEREGVQLLTKLPGRAALELLRQEVALKEPDRWLALALAEHVAADVAANQDAQLARELLEVAASLLGQDTDSIARVAAKGASIRLERNTVGMIIPLRTDDLRRRGIEAASGLALALGIPGGTTKLIVRDDQREVAKIEESLALLNADGAAVIIAGFDTREADIALGYAEKTGVPLVLFRPPSRAIPQDGPVFVLGESPASLRAELARALGTRGSKRVAVLAEERLSADLPADAAALVVAQQPCGAALDFVKAANADSLVVDGGPDCAEGALGGAAVSLPLAFGLEASSKRLTRGLVSTAGLFPMGKAPPGDALLSTYIKREGKDPSWWVALGHDAGMVVKDAVLGLPSEDDAAGAAVAVRKRIVAEAIARAEGSLWTTDAKGFAGGRTMKRTIGVFDPKKKK